MRKIAGLHLLMDGYVRDAKSLDPEFVGDLFDQLVAALGMRYLSPPLAHRVDVQPEKLASDEDEGGWSIMAQITTSHISLHGWPLRKAFMLDVFSCVDFDALVAINLIREVLDIESDTVHVIRRAHK